jgi:hypothetical protein
MGASSPIGKDLMSAIKALSKHTNPGDMGEGTESSMLQKMMMASRSNQAQSPVLQALQQQQQPQAGGMPATPPQGAM